MTVEDDELRNSIVRIVNDMTPDYDEELLKLTKYYAKKKYQEGELKGRIDEVSRCRDAWHGTDDRVFADTMNERMNELKSQLEKEEQ